MYEKIPSLLLHLVLPLNSQVLQQVKIFLSTEVYLFHVSKEEKKEKQPFTGPITTLCAGPGITQAGIGSSGAEFNLVGKLFHQASQLNSWHCPKGDNVEINDTSILTAQLPSLMGREHSALLNSLKNKWKTVKLMGRFCVC